MEDSAHVPGRDPHQLLGDLNTEYYALLGTVTGFDQRQMTIKGWSVTLSLAALLVGFQEGHYALFGLGSATALGFWAMDLLIKGHQIRYYSRMRDIEVAAFGLNRVLVEGLGEVSAPRVDMSWSYAGGDPDWRTDPPWRRSPDELRHLLRRRVYVMPQVLLPHAIAVILGAVLFLAALVDAPGLASLQP